MRDELKYKLKEDYPNTLNPKNRVGFDVGDGWYSILDKLLSKIEKRLVETDNKEFAILQIKEKYGTLRFYTANSDDEIDLYVRQAEQESYFICETCGKPGKTEGPGWIKTLCEGCKEDQYK